MAERFRRFPNVLSYVEVGDNEIVVKDWPDENVTLPLRNVRPEFKRHGGLIAFFLGSGDVTFAESGTTYRVENVIKGRDLHKLVERLQRQHTHTGRSDTPTEGVVTAASADQIKESNLKDHARYSRIAFVAATIIFPLIIVGAWGNAFEEAGEKSFLGRFGFPLLMTFLLPAMLYVGFNESRAARRRLQQLREEMSLRTPGANRSVPAGIVFSRKVISLPTLSLMFDQALRGRDLSELGDPLEIVKPGEWVKRGDPLFALKIVQEKSKLITPVPVHSPVSGLVLWYTAPIRSFGVSGPWAHVLLPENEPPPLHPADVFRKLYLFCADRREDIYEIPNQAINDKITKELNDQLNAAFAFDDVDDVQFLNSRGSYMEWLQQLVAKRPELKAPLRKVLSPDAMSGTSSAADAIELGLVDDEEPVRAKPSSGARSANATHKQRATRKSAAADDMKQEIRLVEEAEPVHAAQQEAMHGEPARGYEAPKGRSQQRAAEIEEARRRWHLPLGFTQAQVNAAYDEKIHVVHRNRAEQLNRDYELLLEAAS